MKNLVDIVKNGTKDDILAYIEKNPDFFQYNFLRGDLKFDKNFWLQFIMIFKKQGIFSS